VVEALLGIVSAYDLIAVQELRSADPAPFNQFMELLPPQYGSVMGPREGRSSSKEQYWFIYNEERLSLLGSALYPDSGDAFEREPFAAWFSVDSFDFILLNIHTKPSDAVQEIGLLDDAARYFSALWNEGDLIIAGDFNADGAYFDEEGLDAIFPESYWTLLIDDSLDTTFASSSNTYDRIVISSSADEDWTGRSGVLNEAFTSSEVSDHYPVWAEFWTHLDAD
jgi:hypothetical protein